MHMFFHLFGLTIPAYGSMIALGIVLGNVAAWRALKRQGLLFIDLLLIEAYALLLGFAGAKILYLITAANTIDWSRIFEADYLAWVLSGGFVFYGGIIGAALGILIAAKAHKLEALKIADTVIFAIPLAHGFGRIGCFCAGCCYGMEYHGSLSVVFPEGCAAPPGVPLFPVQLLESGLLFLLALGLWIFGRTYRREDGFFPKSICVYVISYAVIRFVLEFLRDDAIRGIYGPFSTSQWISLFLVAAVIVYMISAKRKRARNH